MAAAKKRKNGRFDPTIIGDTGSRIYGGIVSEEFLRDLQGQNAIRKFREMADNDPVCGALLFAIKMLCRQVDWNVQTNDDSPEATEAGEFVESLMDDMESPWEGFIDQVCSMFEYGFAPMEIVYKRRNGTETDDKSQHSKHDDGMIGWRKIELRMQHSLVRWEMDAENDVVGMWQQPASKATVLIPMEKLLLFRTTESNTSPQGRSILRSAYRPWYFKKRIEEFEGVGVERDLAGLPMGLIPFQYMRADAAPEEKAVYTGWQRLIKNVRRDQQEGVIIPSDRDDKGNPLFEFKLLSTGGSRVFDTSKILDRYGREIATSVLADFLFLGQHAVGSFALSSDKTALFATAVGGFLDLVEAVINRDALPRLWKLNALDPEIMPMLRHGDLERPNLAEIASFITSLASAGMALFPDRDLENDLREKAGFPPAPEEGPEIDAGAPGDEPDPNKPVAIVGPNAAALVARTNGAANGKDQGGKNARDPGQD